ncbi:MAG: hypothetical protein KDE27_04390, partial [Planctomycetes bacterium]|nr:hypothetical protein [Planctomycetota bacterium]
QITHGDGRGHGVGRAQRLPAVAEQGVAPTAAQLHRLLDDPTTSRDAAECLRSMSLPPDFDIGRYGGGPLIQACRAEGHPERIAQLVERWFAGDAAAFVALTILRVDLRDQQQRVWNQSPPLAPAGERPNPAMLQALLPDVAAEQRIEAANPGPTPALIPRPDPAWRRAALQPVDQALLDAFRWRLRERSKRRIEALGLMR